ncbi:MAG: BglG family transcription antiterminator [Longicatena sp.]
MLSKGSVDLLFILSKKEFCTLDYLSRKLNLSKNTILNLLDDLENYLFRIPNIKLHLIRKSGEGICLSDELQEMNIVLLMLSKHYSLNKQEIYDDRCIQEILILINENNYISLQDLADQMYISKGSIINDLDFVEKIFENYSLKLTRIRNRGIKLFGDESNVRKLFSDIISGKMNTAPIQLFTYDNLNSLYSLFNKEFVDRIYYLIEKMVKKDLELSNIQISALLVHIMIAIQRIQCGESMKMTSDNMDRIKGTRYYNIADKLTSSINDVIGVTFDVDEIGYIAIHLMCSKQVLQVYNLHADEFNVIDEHLKETVNEIVSLISINTGFSAIDDRELIDGLLLHLKPAIERMKNDLSIKNPYLYEIKKTYLPAFEIAIKINELLDREYQIGFDENEIAYITLHVQAHIERYASIMDKKKRVAVVCATGIGSSQLVLARLKNYFGQDVEFRAIGIIEIQEKLMQQNFDMVLSTIPLELNCKVIYIDPFFSDVQLKKVAQLLKSNIKTYKTEEVEKAQIFRLSHISIDDCLQSKEEVLTSICEKLVTMGNVSEEFKDSVFKRELIASTAYGNFAIPHGDVKLVRESCIYVYLSRKGIQWDEKRVEIVFLIALNKDKHAEFGHIFDNLYEIVSDVNKMNKLVHCYCENDVYKIMLGE